jgi:hypothetical protein
MDFMGGDVTAEQKARDKLLRRAGAGRHHVDDDQRVESE